MAPSTPPSPLSDISFASVNSSFTTPPPKPTPPYPPHASTSTISRSSHTSLPPPSNNPLPPHLLPSSSTTRLPKARVFLSRPSSPAPPRRPTSPHPHPHPPPPQQQQQHLPSHKQPRCISDLVSISTHRHHHHHHPHLPADAITFLREDPQLPAWLPADELHDWRPTPPSPLATHGDNVKADSNADPCASESRWVTSLRNLSQLYKPREKEVSDLKGSLLEIRPPTLAERLGLPQRRRRQRVGGVEGAERVAVGVGDAGVQVVEAAEFGCEGRGDEYVGFLGGGDVGGRKGRKAWWRFLRRSG